MIYEFRSQQDPDRAGSGRGAWRSRAGRRVQCRECWQEEGKYAAGDFHNHTTCSDGSISMQKLVKKSTDKEDTPWGLDWFVQAGHGGNGNRNCTLVEDATLGTPAYPFVAEQGRPTTWAQHHVAEHQSTGAAERHGFRAPGRIPTCGAGSRSRSSSTRCSSTSPRKGRAALYRPGIGRRGPRARLDVGNTGQMPDARSMKQPLPTRLRYIALGNATALAQWSYCFDRGDTDKPRQHRRRSGMGNNWNCLRPRQPEQRGPELEHESRRSSSPLAASARRRAT